MLCQRTFQRDGAVGREKLHSAQLSRACMALGDISEEKRDAAPGKSGPWEHSSHRTGSAPAEFSSI